MSQIQKTGGGQGEEEPYDTDAVTAGQIQINSTGVRGHRVTPVR